MRNYEEPDRARLAVALRRGMQQREWTQQVAADELRISRRSLNNLLGADYRGVPQDRTLGAIERVFQFDPNEALYPLLSAGGVDGAGDEPARAVAAARKARLGNRRTPKPRRQTQPRRSRKRAG